MPRNFYAVGVTSARRQIYDPAKTRDSGYMTAADVTSLYTELENLNTKIWIDGSLVNKPACIKI
jgi:hypothetical protein